MEALCYWCGEEVEPADLPPHHCGTPCHWYCGLRSVAGSVAHIQKTCSCYVPGSDEGDPPGLSRREAAKEAARLLYLGRVEP